MMALFAFVGCFCAVMGMWEPAVFTAIWARIAQVERIRVMENE